MAHERGSPNDVLVLADLIHSMCPTLRHSGGLIPRLEGINFLGRLDSMSNMSEENYIWFGLYHKHTNTSTVYTNTP